MRNINVTVTKDEMIVKIKLTDDVFRDATPSSSGKTKVLASTSGNQTFTMPNGKTVTLGVNAYTK